MTASLIGNWKIRNRSQLVESYKHTHTLTYRGSRTHNRETTMMTLTGPYVYMGGAKWQVLGSELCDGPRRAACIIYNSKQQQTRRDTK